MDNYFLDLFGVDVSGHLEQKGRFSYLSWQWAWHELKSRYPDATKQVHKGPDGWPYTQTPAGAFVEVSVTVNGVTETQVHPVLNERNEAIAQPDSFEINTAIQRCLVKAIALHGLGLRVYTGDDASATAATPAEPGVLDQLARRIAALPERQKDWLATKWKRAKLPKLAELDGPGAQLAASLISAAERPLTSVNSQPRKAVQ